MKKISVILALLSLNSLGFCAGLTHGKLEKVDLIMDEKNKTYSFKPNQIAPKGNFYFRAQNYICFNEAYHAVLSKKFAEHYQRVHKINDAKPTPYMNTQDKEKKIYCYDGNFKLK